MLAIAQAESTAAAVIARGLADAEGVEVRLAELHNDSTTLDAMARDSLSALIESAVIATHPRHQYFARCYDLTISSLEWDAVAVPAEDQLADLD